MAYTSLRVPSGACPTHFRVRCWEASTRRCGGYADAGYCLAGGIWSELDDDGVADELEALLVDRSIDEAALRGRLLEFLLRELPRCMRLVPARRREKFIDGFLLAVEEGRADR